MPGANSYHLQPLPNLVEKAVAGDVGPLRELLRRSGPVEQRLLRIEAPWNRLIDSDDVMQVYIEAFLQIGLFDASKPTSFEPWLHRVAENNLRDAIPGLDRQKQ